MDLTEEEITNIKQMHDLVSNRDFYRLLNVGKTSKIDEIKKAYYAISRKWHPDRFFRKDAGAYASMLEQIFIGINQAFKTLSNIEEKTLFDKQYISAVQSSQNIKETGSSTFARHRRSRNRVRKKASDRKKNVGKKQEILKKVKQGIEGKKQKALSFFDLGNKQLEAGKPMEAAASLHVACKLEPENETYQTVYKKARKIAREEKSKTIFAQAENAENYQNYHDAIRLYREAIEYNIPDARAYARLAYLIEKLDPDVRETIRLMRLAVQKDIENPEYRCILAEIYAREGMERNARREFNEALSLQKGYKRAKDGLRSL
jgi:curved DNA-binding protein CbpA